MAFVSRAKAPPVKRSEKGYGDQLPLRWAYFGKDFYTGAYFRTESCVSVKSLQFYLFLGGLFSNSTCNLLHCQFLIEVQGCEALVSLDTI